MLHAPSEKTSIGMSLLRELPSDSRPRKYGMQGGESGRSLGANLVNKAEKEATVLRTWEGNIITRDLETKPG